jgi:hypothetical protein
MDNIQQIIQEILERMVRMETKLDNYNGYREKTDAAFNMATNSEKRLDKIEGNVTWLWRTIAGALILGFIAAFIKWGG